jgi:tRNA(Ile)-lysidine synthase
MQSDLTRRLKDALHRQDMVKPGDRVGVAVSGGADSVALLRLLHFVQEDLAIGLVVLHYQHGLRGEESAGDEDFVARLAGQLGLEFLREEEDVAGWARKHGVNLEDAGRQLRRGFFERAVGEGRVTRVATAHTADDQAETVLAHLLRGTGLAGLTGIHPVLGAMVRPLLGMRRAELRGWLTAMGQGWREDSTNDDPARLRARLRGDVLPHLESEYQPRIVEQLCRLADLAREEEHFWTALAEDRFRAIAEKRGNGIVIGAGDLLRPLPGSLLPAKDAQRALSRRLVRRAVEEVLGHRRGLTAEHVESVLRLAGKRLSGHHVMLPHGVEVARSFQTLFFTPGNPGGRRRRLTEEEQGGYAYSIALPKRGCMQVIVPAIQRRVLLKVVDWPLGAGDTTSREGALDADLLRPPFLLRNWHPGDVYCPRGRRRARKLKELLGEARIEARERALWPVLECGKSLVWVRGLPPAGASAPGEQTRSALLISEEKL